MSENSPTRPHRKTGQPRGRPKGVANKLAAEVRRAFAALLGDVGPEVPAWIRAAAAEDPAKGAQLAIAVAEYFVPKLARNETRVDAGKSFADLVLAAQRQREGKR